MTVVDQYQQRAEELAASTAASVLAVYAAMQAGGLPAPEAVAVIATTVNMANAAAWSLADVFTVAQVEAITARPQPPTGAAPREEVERLTTAVTTILDDLPAPPEAEQPSAEPDPSEVAAHRLERLARSEPLEAGHVAVEVVIDRLPQPVGWVRVLDDDPCERCQRWAEDGRTFPKDAHFKRHLNCNCQQRIVLPGSDNNSTTTQEKTP